MKTALETLRELAEARVKYASSYSAEREAAAIDCDELLWKADFPALLAEVEAMAFVVNQLASLRPGAIGEGEAEQLVQLAKQALQPKETP